jgi:hypothetical protein
MGRIKVKNNDRFSHRRVLHLGMLQLNLNLQCQYLKTLKTWIKVVMMGTT